jgi:hypothetical protein
MINYPIRSNDLQDFPYPSNSDVYVFVGPVDDDLTTVNWKVWNKPKGSTMVYILAVGAGGGGGRGFGRPNGDSGGGGGGGGSGAISRLLIPSFFLPDVLYIRPGSGGEGSNTNGVAGTNGGIAYVCYSQSTDAPNVLIQSSNSQAGGGGTGTGGAVGAAGTAGGVAGTQTTGAQLGIYSATTGVAGAAGGSTGGGNGVSITNVWSLTINSGGAGGGGSDADPFSGGGLDPQVATNFTFINWPNTANALAIAGTSAAASRNGSSGVNIWQPFVSCGGAGGGTNDNSGGNGGNGGIGSGGGGGGTGESPVGRGGNGGPGMVMIISW